MLKCQACDQPATHHITEMVAGEPCGFCEYHLCEDHYLEWEHLPERRPPERKSCRPDTPFQKLVNDSKLREALHDPVVRQEMAAHLLPPLCLALLHEKPEVRTAAVFHIMQLRSDARCATGALRDALKDPDPLVAKAAQIALEYLESDRARQSEHVSGIAHPKPRSGRGDRVKG
jgi:hypothetical protein